MHHHRIRPEERDRALAISECHRYLAEVSYWRNDLFRMVHAMLASLNHAEPAGDSKEGVVAFATVAFLFGLVQLHGVARHYRKLTDAASERVGNPDAAGYAAELEGVYHLVVADWAATHQVAERGIAIFRDVGDRMRWHTCHSHVGYAYLHRGDFDPAGENAREAVAALGPEGLLQSRLWSLVAVLATDLAQDRLDISLAEHLESLLGPAVHDADQLLVRGLVAKAHARAGNDPAALDHALGGRAACRSFPAALVPHDARHRRRGRGPDRSLGRRTGRPRGAPAGPPRNHRAQAVRPLQPRGSTAGRDLRRPRPRHRRRRPLARRDWEKARSIAAKLDMPYEAALADIELAASYPPGSVERVAAAERALAALESLAGHFDAARARALLGPSSPPDAQAPINDDADVSVEPVEVAAG